MKIIGFEWEDLEANYNYDEIEVPRDTTTEEIKARIFDYFTRVNNLKITLIGRDK